jgi:hypothetical protein
VTFQADEWRVNGELTELGVYKTPVRPRGLSTEPKLVRGDRELFEVRINRQRVEGVW